MAARTPDQIEADAKLLAKPEHTIVVTPEEARLLVDQSRAARRAQGRLAPDAAYLLRKLKSGKARIHGHVVEVNDAALS